jgi:hypothetical protein
MPGAMLKGRSVPRLTHRPPAGKLRGLISGNVTAKPQGIHLYDLKGTQRKATA